MKEVLVYQIIDTVSDGVISTFISPNELYAERQFKKFLFDDKLKDSIVKSDFCLVKCGSVSIFNSYSDYMNVTTDANDDVFDAVYGDFFEENE